MKANGDNPISYESYLQQIAGRGRTMLLPALLAAQARYGHISPEVAGAIGAVLRVPLADITGVIEFYSMLYDRPAAKTIIRVCTSPTCSSQGAQVLLKELDQSLAVTPGHATPNGKIYLEKTECLGLCDQAPSALADQTAVGRANGARIVNPPGDFHTAIYRCSRSASQDPGLQGLRDRARTTLSIH